MLEILWTKKLSKINRAINAILCLQKNVEIYSVLIKKNIAVKVDNIINHNNNIQI